MLVIYLVYMALSLLGSTIARSQGVAVVWAVATLIVVGLIGSVPTIGDFSPDRLFKWGASLMSGVPDSAWPAFWISLGLIVAALVAACLVFRHQEV
jgi:hypothetical protein